MSIATMRQEEFKNRYIIKIISSVFLALLNLVIQSLLPRVFSVDEYGYYSYNLNVFTSIVVIGNLSTSNALIAKFSKRNNELGLVYFYMGFYAIVALILNVAIVSLYSFDFFRGAFAGQSIIIILLGLETSVLTKLISDCISMYDASAISRFPAVVQIAIKVVVCCSVVVGYLLGKYNLFAFYFTLIITSLIAITILLYALIQDNKRKYVYLQRVQVSKYIKEFWLYCRPMIIATATSQLVIIFMNWALMKWSGASQQAMFGAAWQFNSLVSYVFSTYVELSKRECAIITEDKESLKFRFEQSLKIIVWLTSYFAIFIAFMSESIVPVLFGDKYMQATLVTGIIMFYTVFQAIGQLTGAFFISTENTKANALISILGQFSTVIFVFLFQVPNFIWNDTLGSVGIALNYLLSNIITVSVSLIYVSHNLKVRISNALLNVIIPIVALSIVSFILHVIVTKLVLSDTIFGLIFQIGMGGAIYTVLLGIIIWKKPMLIGVSKETLYKFIKRGK